MGEIDTKSIEPVQVALYLFEEKGKNRTRGKYSEEVTKQKEELLKELAICKMQIEAKDSAYSELLLQLEHYRSLSEELLILLMTHEVEKSVYADECREAKFRINELEYKISEMTTQLMHAVSEVKMKPSELHNMETELDAAREDKLKALTRSEGMEAVATMEKERVAELVSQVSHLHEAIAILKADWNGKMKEDSEKAVYHAAIETENNQLKMELKNANDEVDHLNNDLESTAKELKGLKIELDETKEKENEAQIEIAMMKSEIHMTRSLLAAANAAEARACSAKSGLYLAVQQLTLEVDKAKKENQLLKQGANNILVESDDLNQPEHLFQAVQGSQKPVSTKGLNDSNITNPSQQHEYSIKIAEKANEHSNQASVTESKEELEALKKELEAAATRIEEYRLLQEQAVTRAEAAEKAKAALEVQVRQLKEQKKRRKAASAAVDRESLVSSRGIKAPAHENPPKNYQPLFKILNMKF